MKRATIVVAVGLLAVVGAARGIETRLLTYPAPPGEQPSAQYRVDVNGRALDVYQARVNDPPWNDPQRGFDAGGPYSFAQFDFSGSVAVTVQAAGRRLENAVVRGVAADLVSRSSEAAAIRIALERPAILSIEPDGKNGPLYLFANPIEENPPKQGDPGVVYFGPGIHRPEGGVVELESGQTLYLAGGAVLQGAVHADGAENIRIRGRGILCGNAWEWRKGPGRMIGLERCRNVAVEGIVLRGAWAWTIVPVGCDDVTIENVKICNGRVLNDDGINPCNSRRVLIRRCFIRTMDDCIALKGLEAELGDVDGVTVEDSILCGDFARITLLGHESRAARMRNIVYRNLDVVHHGLWPVFLLEVSDDMALSDVRFEDVRIAGHGQRNLVTLRPYITQYSRAQTWGSIENVVFKNVSVEGDPGKYSVVVECAPHHGNHRLKGVAFENFRVLGEPLDEQSLRVVLGCWIMRPAGDGIVFSP